MCMGCEFIGPDSRQYHPSPKDDSRNSEAYASSPRNYSNSPNSIKDYN